MLPKKPGRLWHPNSATGSYSELAILPGSIVTASTRSSSRTRLCSGSRSIARCSDTGCEPSSPGVAWSSRCRPTIAKPRRQHSVIWRARSRGARCFPGSTNRSVKCRPPRNTSKSCVRLGARKSIATITPSTIQCRVPPRWSSGIAQPGCDRLSTRVPRISAPRFSIPTGTAWRARTAPRARLLSISSACSFGLAARPYEMTLRRISPALIAHGGAGARGPAAERAERRDALLAAVRCGAELLREGGSALDAVQVTVVELEDDPRFNAGTGSVLTSVGTVEMDASVMVMERGKEGEARISAGAVAAVSRVKNPLMLARAVMEESPHVMLAGSGAHRFARRAGIELCRVEDLITAGARGSSNFATKARAQPRPARWAPWQST